MTTFDISLRPSPLHHSRCECDPDTRATQWKAEICTVLHEEDPRHRRELLDAFLLAQEASIARTIARVQRVARLDSRDKALAFSYFGQALLQMVDRRWLAKGGRGVSQVFNYSSNLPMILEAETRSCLREDRRKGLLDGTAGIPGGSTRDRRDSLVQRSRQLFELEHAHAPSQEELVSFHNERMHATRKDPARQGVLIARQHLQPATVVPIDDAVEAAEPMLTVTAEPDLGVEDRGRTVQNIIDRCEALDQERARQRRCGTKRRRVGTADVARAFFDQHRSGDFPTRAELVEKLDATEPVARREVGTHLQTVLGLARDAFQDYSYQH